MRQTVDVLDVSLTLIELSDAELQMCGANKIASFYKCDNNKKFLLANNQCKQQKISIVTKMLTLLDSEEVELRQNATFVLYTMLNSSSFNRGDGDDRVDLTSTDIVKNILEKKDVIKNLIITSDPESKEAWVIKIDFIASLVEHSIKLDFSLQSDINEKIIHYLDNEFSFETSNLFSCLLQLNSCSPLCFNNMISLDILQSAIKICKTKSNKGELFHLLFVFLDQNPEIILTNEDHQAIVTVCLNQLSSDERMSRSDDARLQAGRLLGEVFFRMEKSEDFFKWLEKENILSRVLSLSLYSVGRMGRPGIFVAVGKMITINCLVDQVNHDIGHWYDEYENTEFAAKYMPYMQAAASFLSSRRFSAEMSPSSPSFPNIPGSPTSSVFFDAPGSPVSPTSPSSNTPSLKAPSFFGGKQVATFSASEFFSCHLL